MGDMGGVVRQIPSDESTREREIEEAYRRRKRPVGEEYPEPSPASPPTNTIPFVLSDSAQMYVQSIEQEAACLPEQPRYGVLTRGLRRLIIGKLNSHLRGQIVLNHKLAQIVRELVSTLVCHLVPGINRLAADQYELETRIDAMRLEYKALAGTLSSLTGEIEGLRQDVNGWHQATQQENAGVRDEQRIVAEQFHQLFQRLSGLEGYAGEMRHLTCRHERVVKTVDWLKREHAYLAGKFQLILNDLKKKQAPDDDSRRLIESCQPAVPRYVTFEDRYRGSREEIATRQEVYMPRIQRACEATRGRVLDLGCGRGEFLEILQGYGIEPLGVDSNEEMVRVCQDRGLPAVLSDGLQYLETVPDHSLAALTAFQVIEHLSLDAMDSLIHLAFQKLKDGGVVILETINPYSLFALSMFYLDLSHQRPIPIDSLRFLMETAGYKDVETVFPYTIPDEMKLAGDDPNTRRLNEVIFGPPDYAVAGWK